MTTVNCGATKNAYSSLFTVKKPESVKLSIIRRTHTSYSRQHVFKLIIDQKEWEFLRKKMPGFPFDYKLECLGVKFPDFVMAEGHIA